MSEPHILIKQMDSKEIAAVINLQTECGFDGWECTWYEDHLDSPNVICLTAQRNDQLCGFISTQILADEVEIYLVAVARTFRRKKIATSLLENLLARAQAKHLRSIFLEVRSGNLPAQNLYQSFGFNLAGVRKNYYQNPAEDAYILRRQI